MITLTSLFIVSVRWLLLVGANPIARDRFGNTPLNEAKSFGHPAVENLLKNFDLDQEMKREREREQKQLEKEERSLSGILSGTQSLSKFLVCFHAFFSFFSGIVESF